MRVRICVRESLSTLRAKRWMKFMNTEKKWALNSGHLQTAVLGALENDANSAELRLFCSCRGSTLIVEVVFRALFVGQIRLARAGAACREVADIPEVHSGDGSG